MKSPASSRLVSLGAPQCVAIALRLKILFWMQFSSLTQCSKHRCLCGLLALWVVGLHAMLAYADSYICGGREGYVCGEGFFLQEGCLGLCGHRSLMSECSVSPTLLTTRCNHLWGLFLRSARHLPITEACRSEEKGLGWLGMQRMRHTLMA